MKYKLIAIVIIGLSTSHTSAFARAGDRMEIDRKPTIHEPEIVRWIGEVKDESSDHTTEHRHSLEFVNEEEGKVYDIVDSPELVKLHHETEMNYIMEIVAEKTPRFLFWGGNLIVKNFKVVEETTLVPHIAPIKRTSSRSELNVGRP